MKLALDTETTGLDHYHGARPFYVTCCDDQGNLQYWEWDVDPLTRKPKIPKRDLDEIEEIVNNCDELVFQNAKFDVAALGTVRRRIVNNLDWSKVHDTLQSSHILTSNQPHDLTTQALVYLDINLKPLEIKLKEAVTEARRVAKAKYPKWRIASDRLPEMPSAKEGTSCFDYWLPRAIANAEGYPAKHLWHTVLRDYSNADPASTIGVHLRHMELIEEGGLTAIYQEGRKLLKSIFMMEDRGIGINKKSLLRQRREYTKFSESCAETCNNIAHKLNYSLELPKGSNNNSLTYFCFGSPTEIKCVACKGKGQISAKKVGPKSIAKFVRGSEKKLVECPTCEGEGKVEQEKEHWLNLPVVGKTKGGAPQFDKTAIETYLVTLDPKSPQYKFVKAIGDKRKRDTSLSFMRSYEKFMVSTDEATWHIIHPSLNSTGTSTLRFSSQNPNEQQISKKEIKIQCPKCNGRGCENCDKDDDDGKPTGLVPSNLRNLFGPLPGREWWSLDYENLELRIPAYESGEKAMIELFEKPNDAPYFGSYHLMNASIVYPDLFWPLADTKGAFKDKYETTWYSWIKNFGFAVQYGAQLGSGTADKAAHKKGAQKLVASKLKCVQRLTDEMIAHANKYGFVETIPDKTVDPDRGYPIQCSRSHWGTISPTIPLSYHIQSTAMWCTRKAMVRIQDYFDRKRSDCFLALQVHDEVVVDLPAGGKKNLPIVEHVQKLMQKSGEDIGVPLKVSIGYHPRNWGEKVKL